MYECSVISLGFRRNELLGHVIVGANRPYGNTGLSNQPFDLCNSFIGAEGILLVVWSFVYPFDTGQPHILRTRKFVSPPKGGEGLESIFLFRNEAALHRSDPQATHEVFALKR